MLQFSISITVTAMRLKMVQTFKFISNSNSFHSQQSLSLKNTTAKTIQEQNNITTIPKSLYSSLFYYIVIFYLFSVYLSQPWMSWILAMMRHSFLRESGKRPSQSQRRPGRRLRNQPRSPSSGKKESKKEKNEQAQKKRREKKTSTKKGEKIQRKKKTNEKATLEKAQGLFSELLDLSTRVDIRPLEHKPG